MKRFTFLFLVFANVFLLEGQSWIRVNQLGYLPESVKVAVWMSKDAIGSGSFSLCDALTDDVVFKGSAVIFSGSDWGMRSSARLDFSDFEIPGGYYIIFNQTKSDPFRISAKAYSGTSDYILRYMRQQRCGYNPWFADSCHTFDGFIVDHPTRTGEIIDAKGGWHDASDYLQYVTTSANAVYQMLYSYRKNPEVYGDNYDRSGNKGSNGIPDIIDEALWGIDWLLKMNPSEGEMYNQIADDRDHRGFRLPTEDTASYGFGLYRPVYYVTGKSQGLSKYKNRTTGVSSVAGKYASAFALGAQVLKKFEPELSQKLAVKAGEAWDYALTDIGVTQTACTVSPYFYEEENYADDLELAAWEMFSLTGDSLFLIKADYWGALEPVTPWIEKDTARHYQFYPFVNMAHPSIASSGSRYAQKYQAFMKKGLNILDQRRESNPFRVTIPFIWCSNNYVTASIVQHRLYREISGSDRFIMSEAALRDWLFGCNPWGTSMICGLPAGGDFPVSPHAAITLHLNKVPEGGLIDGPVYSSIYKNLIGIRLLKPDEYNDFQYGRAVYHDDIGDYSTNEPTMDGTACISLVLSSLEADGKRQGSETKGEVKDSEGAIIRTDKSEKKIHLIFSADEYGEGFEHILNVLSEHSIKASFFLTGNFLRNNKFRDVISRLKKEDHYIGPHSDRHLLYASWNDRDSLMITKAEFQSDLKANYRELEKIGIELPAKRYFLPPYEWYNSSITSWSSDMGVDIINFTPGTGTNADYTTPDMKNYRTSNELLNNLKKFEEKEASGLNGAFILIHPGTEAARTDKLYLKLDEIIEYFSGKGYTFNKL